MEMKPVKSSNIAAVGYHAPTKTMHVQFSNGSTYAYSGVEAEHHEAFTNADSVGSHFAQKIRNKYEGEKI